VGHVLPLYGAEALGFRLFRVVLPALPHRTGVGAQRLPRGLLLVAETREIEGDDAVRAGRDADGEPQIEGGDERRAAVDHRVLAHEDQLTGSGDGDRGGRRLVRRVGGECAREQPGLGG
jgi:hypothetical protein